jgi:hypothetical protein
MDWKPFARGSAACSLPFAVLCGEEKQHLHVEYHSETVIIAEPIVVTSIASSFTIAYN